MKKKLLHIEESQDIFNEDENEHQTESNFSTQSFHTCENENFTNTQSEKITHKNVKSCNGDLFGFSSGW